MKMDTVEDCAKEKLYPDYLQCENLAFTQSYSITERGKIECH